MNDGDSGPPRPRGGKLPAGYRFAARCRDRSRSYLHPTVVEVRPSGGPDVACGVNVTVVATGTRAARRSNVERHLVVDATVVEARPGGREEPVHPGEDATVPGIEPFRARV